MRYVTEKMSDWTVGTGYKAAKAGGGLGTDRAEKAVDAFLGKDEKKKSPVSVKSKKPNVVRMGKYRWRVVNSKGKTVKTLPSKDAAYDYMRKNSSKLESSNVKEGLGDMAHNAEKDHEVQMARSELYKIAKYAIKLHEMMKAMDPHTDLESWVQAKITKSAEFLDSVYHHLEYENLETNARMEAKERVRKAFEAGGDEYKGSLEERLNSMNSIDEAKKDTMNKSYLKGKGLTGDPDKDRVKNRNTFHKPTSSMADKKKTANKKAARGKIPMETSNKK